MARIVKLCLLVLFACTCVLHTAAIRSQKQYLLMLRKMRQHEKKWNRNFISKFYELTAEVECDGCPEGAVFAVRWASGVKRVSIVDTGASTANARDLMDLIVQHPEIFPTVAEMFQMVEQPLNYNVKFLEYSDKGYPRYIDVQHKVPGRRNFAMTVRSLRGVWYGNENNPIAGAFESDRCFPVFLDWKPKFKDQAPATDRRSFNVVNPNPPGVGELQDACCVFECGRKRCQACRDRNGEFWNYTRLLIFG